MSKHVGHTFPSMPILKSRVFRSGCSWHPRNCGVACPVLLCHDLRTCGLNGRQLRCSLLWSLTAAGGCLLTAADCVKMLRPPVSLVTGVYFYLTDIWKVITTATLHCSVYYAQAINCLGSNLLNATVRVFNLIFTLFFSQHYKLISDHCTASGWRSTEQEVFKLVSAGLRCDWFVVTVFIGPQLHWWNMAAHYPAWKLHAAILPVL